MALTKEQLTPLIEQDMSWAQMLDVLGCSYGQLQYWMGKYQLKTKWMVRQDRNKELLQEEKKECSQCVEVFTLEEFPVDERSADRHSSECLYCSRIRTSALAKASYDKDPETWKARGRKWRSENRDWTNQYAKEYGKANREKRNEYLRGWFKRNPGMAKIYRHQREARKRDAAGFFTKEQLIARIEFYGGLCYLCGCDWYALPKVNQTIDHVIPLNGGGSQWSANLRPACRSCNSSKSDTPLSEYKLRA
jgi:5-methylcytosine-specific restriction endonuclease McrA